MSVNVIAKSLHPNQRGNTAGFLESLQLEVRNLWEARFRFVPNLLPTCCHRGPNRSLSRFRPMEKDTEVHAYCIFMPENVHKRAFGRMFMRSWRTVRFPFADFEKGVCQPGGVYSDFLSAMAAFCLLFSSSYRRMKVAFSRGLSAMRACSSLRRRAFAPSGNQSLR